MPEIAPISQPPEGEHIACCGLFCTNCGAFKKKKCSGCQVKPFFSRCKVRSCCVERKIENCSACADFSRDRSFKECGKLNNFIAKVFGLIFGSDRAGALAILRDLGRDKYLAAKKESGKH